MSPATFITALLIFVGVPVSAILYMAHRFFRFRERKLEIEAGMAAEKAAQYAAHTRELEQRLRVVEQIVTDGGAQTAAQIEALRRQPAVERLEKGANA